MRSESHHLHSHRMNTTGSSDTRITRGSTEPEQTDVFESALRNLCAAGIGFEILVETVGRAA